MTTWIDEYQNAETLDDEYRILRDKISKLRKVAHQTDDRKIASIPEVKGKLAQMNRQMSGKLIVFLASDFGTLGAFRPDDVSVDVQNNFRRVILSDKYEADEELNQIRKELLDSFPSFHKVFVAEYQENKFRYHLPEGTNSSTNFLTVREMVGLVDYTTNSSQSEQLTYTY